MARLRPHEAVVDLRSRFTGEGRRQELVALAHEAIAATDSFNARTLGVPLEHEVFVDGRAGVPIESVREGGAVVAVWPVHLPAIDFAWETLARLSPVDTGRYQNSHRLLINGDEAGPPPVSIGPLDEVTFVNLLPYARRLEHGWSKQAPNGIYEVAAQMVKARFGNIVDVRFNYQRFTDIGYEDIAAEFTPDQTRRHGDDALPTLTLAPKRRR